MTVRVVDAPGSDHKDRGSLVEDMEVFGLV